MRCRSSSRTAGPARSSSSSRSSARSPTRRRTAATRATRSTSSARRCPATASATSRPGRGWGVERIAAAWTVLMARLGYERYGAQGGDWGTSVSARIGQQDADHVAGIHLTPPLAPPDPATFDDLTERERAALAALEQPRRRTPATRRSSPPGRRRSATGWSTRRPRSAPGSSRSSAPGPTATATRRTCSPATSSSTT